MSLLIHYILAAILGVVTASAGLGIKDWQFHVIFVVFIVSYTNGRIK